MDSLITWSLGSSSLDNEENLKKIALWWSQLNGQEIQWKQRPLPESGQRSEINWETQKLDETIALLNPELRGITLYWYKSGSEEERNITVNQLELDLYNQQLDILPASGRNYQIRVTLPKIIYQNIKLENPQFGSLLQPSGDLVLLFRDERQRLEVQVTLSAANAEQLKQKFS